MCALYFIVLLLIFQCDSGSHFCFLYSVIFVSFRVFMSYVVHYKVNVLMYRLVHSM